MRPSYLINSFTNNIMINQELTWDLARSSIHHMYLLQPNRTIKCQLAAYSIDRPTDRSFSWKATLQLSPPFVASIDRCLTMMDPWATVQQLGWCTVWTWADVYACVPAVPYASTHLPRQHLRTYVYCSHYVWMDQLTNVLFYGYEHVWFLGICGCV
jgi:hypothetical protein